MQSDYEFLKGIVQRPGMYVGETRLDYVQIYYLGWKHDEAPRWNVDYDLQRWLFLNQSVSICHAASINAWSLMYRCYGIRRKAIEVFRDLLDEMPFSKKEDVSLDDTVSHHIWSVYRYCEYGDEPENILSYNKVTSADFYPTLSVPIKGKIDGSEKTYEGIVKLVEEMIAQPYDDLFVYLHYECYFMQVRFLYHTRQNGWVDNVSLAGRKDYYNNLVVLHAFASLVQKEEHPNHSVVLHCKDGAITSECCDCGDEWHDVFNNDHDMAQVNEENSLFNRFEIWKKNVGI